MTKECPHCGEDISGSYEPADRSVGIMNPSWFCHVCDTPVDVEPDEFDDPREAAREHMMECRRNERW